MNHNSNSQGCNRVAETANVLQTEMVKLSTMLAEIEKKLDTIGLVTIGRDNAEGLRSEYQRHAYSTALSRRQRGRVTSLSPLPTIPAKVATLEGESEPDGEPRVASRSVRQRRKLKSVVDSETEPELTVLMTTFLRRNLEDNTEYLRAVLGSLAAQYSGPITRRRVRVVIVNNSPKTHRGIEEAAKRVLDEHKSSPLQVVVTESSDEFTDPYDTSLKLKVDLPNRPDLLESWTPSRLHCRHLVESFSKALDFPGKYTLIWEDDMLMCGDASNGTLLAVLNSIDLANEVALDWTAIRLGFGGNGLVFHTADIPLLSDYILANMHRKPPDWLMTEWYKGMTYTAQIAIGDRHRGFTHELNFAEHIGSHSSFPGREDQGKKDSKSHVNYEIPACFDTNWWLLPAERFDKACSGKSILSPCE